MPRDHTVAVAFFNSGPAFSFRPKPYAAGGTLFHASRFTHTGRHIKKRGRSPARKTSRRDLKQKILPRLQEYFLPEMPEQPHEHAPAVEGTASAVAQRSCGKDRSAVYLRNQAPCARASDLANKHFQGEPAPEQINPEILHISKLSFCRKMQRSAEPAPCYSALYSRAVVAHINFSSKCASIASSCHRSG